ncbi:hypothetical protein [Micromonospora sp. IBHARD004]|uniref:hypothetical protein n=1 Tax=Micromonospora sp. IBHARD004 TaxID=3457764 RepID=UPI0040580F23
MISPVHRSPAVSGVGHDPCGGELDGEQMASLSDGQDRRPSRLALPLLAAPLLADMSASSRAPGQWPAHQYLKAPIVLIWDNLNTHVSTDMRELVANRDWLHVIQLADLAAGDTRVCR